MKPATPAPFKPPNTAVRAANALLWAALLPAVQAHAAIIDIAWDAQDRFAHETRVAPGKFAEVCGKVERGQTIVWRYAADKALEFNIHYHVGKDVAYPARKTAAAADGRLHVGSGEDHCWMWTNKSEAPVALTLALQRER